MENVKVVLTREQQHNLLILLDSVQVKGIQSANEYLHIVNLIQRAEPNQEEKESGV